jgi:hypothetical protein
MTPLTIFDYLFYKIVTIYQRFVYTDKDVKLFAGIAILSLFQNMNLQTIISLINPISEIKKEFSVVFFLSFYFVLVLLNFFRYSKFKPYELLDIKWANENEATKRLQSFAIFAYCVLSIVMLSVV